MSGCIDKTYKDLTKNKSYPQGGVAFLSLEDAEVCLLLIGIDGVCGRWTDE